MLTHEGLHRLLARISTDTDSDHLFKNYTILGEAIHVAFPAGSPMSSAHEALGKQIGEIRHDNRKGTGAGAGTETQRIFLEIRELAAAAKELLCEFGSSYPETVSNSNEREVELLVNQAFYKSQPFHFAKWTLIAALILVGVGSGSVAGFTVGVWDRMKEAQQTFDAQNQKYNEMLKRMNDQENDLENKQKSAFESMQKVLDQKSEQYDALVKDALAKAQQTFDAYVNNANTFIENQKDKVSTDVNTASTFIEQQKGKVSTEAVAASGFIDGQKKSLDPILTTASQAIETKKGQFSSGLDLALEQAKTGIDTKISDQLAVGTQKIESEVQSKLNTLAQSIEEGKKRLAGAADQGIITLNGTLDDKLKALNTKSSDAAKTIDGIVSSIAAQRDNFVNAMNSRLSEWDSERALEAKRRDDIKRAFDDIDTRTKDLGAQLDALKSSSQAALEVAQQLRTGTETGELPIIGKVLERSAFLFVLTLIIAVVGALFAGGNLLVTILRKPIPDGPRPPTAPF
jgi:hypothetical protein